MKLGLKKILFFISLIILCWIYSIRFFDIDFDLWARLAVGKVFFSFGQVMMHDPFSFTLQKDMWIDHEWGSSVIFHVIANYFGDTGLVVLKIAVLSMLFFFIHKIIALKDEKNSYNIFYFLILLLAIHNGFASTVRCQIFTFLLFGFWLISLENIRLGKNKYLWVFPLSMLLWANLHGGFMAGIGLLGVYGIGEFLNKKPWKKYFLILIPTILVTLINPYGFEYWKYIADAVTMARSHVVEWQPTRLFEGAVTLWLGFKILLTMTIAAIGFDFFKNKFKNIDITKLLVIAAMLFMALKHIKHQPFFVIAAGSLIYSDCYIMIETLKAKLKFNLTEKARNISGIFGYSLVIILGFLVIAGTNHQITVPDSKYPIFEVEFIKKNNLKGNLAAPFNWGSYLAYKLYPDCLISIDGRYEEVYPNETEYMATNFLYVRDKNWYELANNYNLDILLLRRKDKSYALIKEKPEWREVFYGPRNSIFVSADYPQKEFEAPDIDIQKIYNDKYKTRPDFLDKIREHLSKN